MVGKDQLIRYNRSAVWFGGAGGIGTTCDRYHHRIAHRDHPVVSSGRGGSLSFLKSKHVLQILQAGSDCSARSDQGIWDGYPPALEFHQVVGGDVLQCSCFKTLQRVSVSGQACPLKGRARDCDNKYSQASSASFAIPNLKHFSRTAREERAARQRRATWSTQA